jgi:non-ribosomal peptide synthetase component E (peptide arylation enzyme)
MSSDTSISTNGATIPASDRVGLLELHDSGLSYVHGTSDIPLIGMAIGDMFDRVAEALPDHDALVSRHQGLRWSYRQLKEECDRFARGLIALGVTKGDRVGIWSPNYAEWVVAQFATPKIGAILVNINPAYRTHELEYALAQSGCSVLVSSRRRSSRPTTRRSSLRSVRSCSAAGPASCVHRSCPICAQLSPSASSRSLARSPGAMS